MARQTPEAMASGSFGLWTRGVFRRDPAGDTGLPELPGADIL